MRLKKFRIYNYKSIMDSGDCCLSSDFTTLIGKNESGKTAVLEAIRDFDREQYVISQQAYPLSSIGEEPSLEMVFSVSKEELEGIEKDSGAVITEEAREFILREGLCLTKSALGDYGFKDGFLNRSLRDVAENEDEKELSRVQIKKQKLDGLLSGFPVPELNLDGDQDAAGKSLKELRISVKKYVGLIKEEEKREEIVGLIQEIIKEVNDCDHERLKHSSRANFMHSVVQRLPRFVFFGELKDILPFEIAMKSLKENEAVMDFARIADLDLDKVMKTEDLQRRINLLNRHSAIISGDFLGFWKQNQIELIVRPQGDNLLFGVKEADKVDFFKVEQRSKGFQWFLSFYLRLNSYKTDNVIVLIDEPGTNLHPLAQRDILNILKERSSNDMQVIFSTHSSALIDTDRLDRIRLLIKDNEKGSVIKDDIHNVMDEETLMPIVAAIGAKSSSRIPAIIKESKESEEEAVQEAVKESEEEAIKENEEEKEDIGETEPENVKPVIERIRKRPALFRLFNRKEE